jgi:hypothetical protein
MHGSHDSSAVTVEQPSVVQHLVANVNLKTKQSESILRPNKANPCHAWLSYMLHRRVVAIVEKSEANTRVAFDGS